MEQAVIALLFCLWRSVVDERPQTEESSSYLHPYLTTGFENKPSNFRLPRFNRNHFLNLNFLSDIFKVSSK
jgi:hypothetical protein